MTQSSDALIADYLGRLRAACWPLGEVRTSELVDGIAEHIREAAAEVGREPEAIAGVLQRLGAPERIAQEAADEDPVAHPLLVQQQTLTRETWTVALLTVGNFVVPVVSWVVGLALLLTSKRWLWWEKVLGALVVPGGPFGAVLLLSLTSSWPRTTLDSCVVTEGHTACDAAGQSHLVGHLGVLALVASFLGSFAVGAFLWSRAKHRAGREGPRLVPLRYSAPG